MRNTKGGKGYSPTQILNDPALISKIVRTISGIHSDERRPFYLVRSLTSNLGLSHYAAYAIKKEGIARGLFLKVSREGIVRANNNALVDNLLVESLLRCGTKNIKK